MMKTHCLLTLATYTPFLVSANNVAAASSTAPAVMANSVVASAASPAALSPHHIHCYCNLIYEPVCGSNGITYSNECVMRCVSADNVNNGRPPVHLLHRAKCRTLSCNCPQIYDPVCGSNNQTFPNDCYRVCDNTYRAEYGLPLVSLAYRDICKPTLCFCPDAIIPVCGTDNKTYRNVCYLQCCSRISQARSMPSIYVQKSGVCKNEMCNCPLVEKQICASDGNSYYNKCALDCQNRKRDQLGLEPLIYQYSGECIKCICTANIDPVCGSDGNTYSNYCLLLCENRTRKRQGVTELTMRWRGPCNCGCLKQYQPVCANDRDTWPNRCFLDCENKKRALSGQPRLSVLYEGECRLCNCDYCPNRYDPVCGSDHQTYQSSCFLKCNSNCRVNDGMLPLWKIANRECYR